MAVTPTAAAHTCLDFQVHCGPCTAEETHLIHYGTGYTLPCSSSANHCLDFNVQCAPCPDDGDLHVHWGTGYTLPCVTF